MKTVYFVRHGETEGNKAKLYQHWDVPLSEQGRSQAKLVAERFANIPIDVVIASDMTRADETARIIAERTGHTVVAQPLMQELHRPTAIRGKTFDDPEAKIIRKFIDENFDTDKKHSDEENFADLKARGLKALEYIVNRPEERLLVVTHGTYMNMLLALMAFGEKLTAYEFSAFYHLYALSNTGITKCKYDKRWQVLNWNDDAHLGELA